MEGKQELKDILCRKKIIICFKRFAHFPVYCVQRELTYKHCTQSRALAGVYRDDFRGREGKEEEEEGVGRVEVTGASKRPAGIRVQQKYLHYVINYWVFRIHYLSDCPC